MKVASAEATVPPATRKKATPKKVAKQPTLLQKLHKVFQQTHGLEKDGLNPHHKYNYVSESAVLRHLRPLLQSEGLMILPKVDQFAVEQAGKSRVARMNMTFTVADTATGESLAFPWSGESADHSDKAFSKCLTAVQKSFLRQLFLLPSGEDADEDSPNLQPVLRGLTEEQQQLLSRLAGGGQAYFDEHECWPSDNDRNYVIHLLDQYQRLGADMSIDPGGWERLAAIWHECRESLKKEDEGA